MTAFSSPAAAWPQPGRIVASYTIPWPQTDLLAFLRRAVGEPRFFWDSERSRTSFAAFGVAAVLRAAGDMRFDEVRRQAHSLFDAARIDRVPEVPDSAARLRLVGGFAFRPGCASAQERDADIWSSFAAAFFVLPRYILFRHGNDHFLTVNALASPEDAWAAQEALWELPAPLDIHLLEMDPAPVAPRDLEDRSRWEAIVRQATEAIGAGRLDKVVFARARELPGIANPLAGLARLAGRYPDCYRFLIEPAAGSAFFGATPELLASSQPGQVETMALAGSLCRGETLAEDERLGEQLLASPKDRREHQFVIEAILERLKPLLESPQTGETGLLRLSNIQHLCTPISGVPLPGCDLLALAAALHPTPAVGGLPVEPALALIEQSETVSRGWFAGPVGWMDSAGEGEFVVALRSAITDGTRTRLYAGAGIVAGSDPAHEWEETELKFRPMMEALGCRPV